MKNAGSLSDIKGSTNARGKKPKKQEAEDTFLNKPSFVTEVLDAIRHPFSYTQAQALVMGCTVFRRKESFGSVLQQRAVSSSRYHLGQLQW